MRRLAFKICLTLALLLFGPACFAQSATINWTNVHQVIDGFGAARAQDAGNGGSTTSAEEGILFGTGSGSLGLSLLRVGVPNGGANDTGDCSSISTSCAGGYVNDMQAVIANGGRVFGSPWSPPAAYKTNGSTSCTAGGGNGALAAASYANYATWLANFVRSLKTYNNITLYAISVQNEPDLCTAYDSAVWTASQMDTFIKTNLGPTFAANGLSTLILMPDAADYYRLSSNGGTCGGDSACNAYVGGITWHDYDASYTAPTTVNAAPYPSGWPEGKRYWETEASCGTGFGPGFCEAGWNTDINDALSWAAVIDDRMAVENANAWVYWKLVAPTADDEGLMSDTDVVAKRAYMMGQYSRFIRPGYYRIDATHIPQTGISVSAYQNTSTGTLAIVATNYTASAVTQTFSLTNGPTFTSVTPYITSATQDIRAQAPQSVSSNSFIYTLPAASITTFVATSISSTPPVPPANLRAVVN